MTRPASSVRPRRVVLTLTEEEYADLAELADRWGVSMAHAHRSAVAHLLRLARESGVFKPPPV